MTGTIIRATATIAIDWPASAVEDSDEQEGNLRLANEFIHRTGAIARAALANEGARFVQAVGIDVPKNVAFVRYAVPAEKSDDDLRKLGDALTETFYRECGVIVANERKRREENDIAGPLWTLEVVPVKQ